MISDEESAFLSSLPFGVSGSVLRVTNTDGYDSTSIISLGADGTYIHTSAPLGDYITLAKPDTITFSNSLPTYYC